MHKDRGVYNTVEIGGIMRVEELTQYGKTLSSLPKEALKKQESIVLREIRNKFGLIGILPFFIRLFLEQRRLKRRYS